MSGKKAKKLRRLAKHLIETGQAKAQEKDQYKYSDKKVKPTKKSLKKLYIKRGYNPKDIEHIDLPEGYEFESETIELVGCQKALVKWLKKQEDKFKEGK